MNLTWIPNITPNVISQRASKRRKAVGGAFDTTGFTPPNDMGTAVAAATTTTLDNLVYEFKVENVCTVNGPTINNNGIREHIKFACILPTITATGTSVTISVPVVGLDITKANFVLKKQSDNSIVGTSGLIPRIGSNISYTFTTGVTSATAYYLTVELAATTNGADVLSSDISQLNALCGGNVSGYQVTTELSSVICDRYMNATAAPITGLSYVPCSGVLNSTLAPGGQICIVSGSLTGGGALTLIEANSKCAPDYNILVENLSTLSNVDSLTNASLSFFFPSIGAFPLLPGQSLQGSQAGFTGVLRMAVSGSPEPTTVMTLNIAGAPVATVPVPTAGTYDFPSRSYLTTELMHVTLI